MKKTDLLVVGGGINGVGIACDAAGRGLSVRLVESIDLASGTSSISTKLIHGGLRYLEYYEFRLVREALAEREVLLNKVPFLVKPMRFILPHRHHLRPAWLIRCGLFLYDNIAGKSVLPKSKTIFFKSNNSPLVDEITQGFVYSDCWVDDSKLVILNALQAKEKGAYIHTQTRCLSLKPKEGVWVATLQNQLNQEIFEVEAKAVINATGPWAQQFYEEAFRMPAPRKTRMIKGSHLVCKNPIKHEEAYILQNEDKRIVFVIPYLDDYCIIGTTDKEYKGDVRNIKIDQDEISYLLAVYNAHFKIKISEQDILSSYSGVRPLCDDESSDPSAITRDYTLELSQIESLPIMTIFGGKLTTYRKLAEATLQKLKPFFPKMGPSWTHASKLPGADQTTDDLREKIQATYSWLPTEILERWLRQYGSRALKILEGTHSLESLGKDFGGGLTEKEVEYLINQEWARSPDDILERRTRFRLTATPVNEVELARFMREKILTCLT